MQKSNSLGAPNKTYHVYLLNQNRWQLHHVFNDREKANDAIKKVKCSLRLTEEIWNPTRNYFHSRLLIERRRKEANNALPQSKKLLLQPESSLDHSPLFASDLTPPFENVHLFVTGVLGAFLFAATLCFIYMGT
jgi:hypothetical protein